VQPADCEAEAAFRPLSQPTRPNDPAQKNLYWPLAQIHPVPGKPPHNARGIIPHMIVAPIWFRQSRMCSTRCQPSFTLCASVGVSRQGNLGTLRLLIGSRTVQSAAIVARLRTARSQATVRISFCGNAYRSFSHPILPVGFRKRNGCAGKAWDSRKSGWSSRCSGRAEAWDSALAC